MGAVSGLILDCSRGRCPTSPSDGSRCIVNASALTHFGGDHMKASQLLAIGVIAFSMSFVAGGSPAPSPALIHKKKLSSYEQRPAVPCLIGTESCSASNHPPVKACHLGAHSDESCSTDGVRAIEAYGP